MAKKVVGLTARGVETIKTPGLHADGHGLYLQVTATGVKTWIFRYVSPGGESKGKRRDMGLGSVKLLEVARAVTLRDSATAYIAAMAPGWKNAKHRSQWDATLETYAFPIIGDLPVDGIDTGLVLKVLEPIWPTKTETASRLRGRLEAILDYAKVRGYRAGENPARWKGHLDHILPAKGDVAEIRHHASLPYTEMPSFRPKLQAQDGLGARALELCILTATRTGDVLGARWQELDLEARTWSIPGERMKAGQDHRIPLASCWYKSHAQHSPENGRPPMKPPFLKRIAINRDKAVPGEFPFDRLAFLRGGDFALDLSSAITILVGENGSGKSTLLEAVSAAAGFPALGGSQHHRPGPQADRHGLSSALRLSWLPKVSNGFFFQAESFFSFANYIDEVGDVSFSGGRNLHHQSHGESFLALFSHRLDGQQRGIFFMDEPEIALSPTRQLAFLRMLWDWQRGGRVQAIIATHSPIIMSLPGAALLSLDGDQIRPIRLEETEHYRVMRSFLGNPERALRDLLREDEE